MKQENYIVYICADQQGRITSINSSAFLLNSGGWIQVDQGLGDRYHHAQKHYFPGSLTNRDGTHRYIYDPALTPAYRGATAEELAAERAEIEAAREATGPTAERLRQQMITDLELQGNELGQAITDLELQSLEQGQAFTDFELREGNADVV